MIIVSTELDEVFSLADRIAVMYDGRIVGTVSPDIEREEIGLLMAGAQTRRRCRMSDQSRAKGRPRPLPSRERKRATRHLEPGCPRCG